MKKVSKIFAVALCLTLMFTLVGCNSYGKIARAFEKEGWKESETLGNIVTDITKDFEEDIVVTPHLFTSGIKTAVVFEFKSTDDMKKAVEDSATLKGLIKDIQNSDYVNGNCVLFTLIPEAVTIFKEG